MCIHKHDDYMHKYVQSWWTMIKVSLDAKIIMQLKKRTLRCKLSCFVSWTVKINRKDIVHSVVMVSPLDQPFSLLAWSSNIRHYQSHISWILTQGDTSLTLDGLSASIVHCCCHGNYLELAIALLKLNRVYTYMCVDVYKAKFHAFVLIHNLICWSLLSQ